MSGNVELVRNAMLAVQHYPWEQGVCAQALWECGDVTTAMAMAHDAVLRQKEDGRFHDILDEADTFVEGTAAMMMAAFVYRGMVGGWLSEKYAGHAELVRMTMENYVDEMGLIQEVCGCPDFMQVGASAESRAAYLMMHGWYEKWRNK